MTPQEHPSSQPLAAFLRQAAADLQTLSPPPELQARVRAAVTSATPRPGGPPVRPASSWQTWSGGAAFATLLLASTVLLLRPLPLPVPPADEALRFGAFVPVAAAERWPREAAPAWVVSTELQGERLAALGLPYDPGRAGESVRAELLLHPSGEVLAVRLLN